MSTTAEQDQVLALVDAINHVLAGVPIAHAQTAMTLAVVTGIISTSTSAQEREMQAAIFTQQVKEYIARPEIVSWVLSGVRPTQVGRA
jgi:hypothetical protein